MIEAGDFVGADGLCAALLRHADDSMAAELHFLRGSIALRERRFEAAAGHFGESLARRGDAPEFHVACAQAYRGLADTAREAGQLELALAHLPAGDSQRPRLMLRLAGALYELGRLDEAEAWYRRLLELEPDNLDALLCMAVVREPLSVDEARAYLDRHVAARDGAAVRLRRALILPAVLQSEEHIDEVRARLDRDLDEVLARRWPAVEHPEFDVGSTAFALAYHGRNDRDLVAKLGRACRAVYAARAEPPLRTRARGQRLRVGFVSSYFHSHSVARTTLRFSLDLPRADFATYLFAITPNDDESARAIRAGAEHYVALPRDLGQIREAIEQASLDVLFYTDIGMDPYTYFLAFWRLAPVQLVSWGHPVTTGVDTVDYFVSAEAVEAPGSEDQYGERLLRLPAFFLPRYERPVLQGPLRSREMLGMPADRHLYYCLQNVFKLHPEFDFALRRILEQDGRGEVVLLEAGGRGAMAQLEQRFRRTLGALVERVRFLPRMPQQDYLAHLAAADVVLDPFHFGGGNSSCEPLSLGVPLVTLPAFQLRGRLTLGLYREMGIEDCVARSPEDFAAIALRLAGEPEYRRDVSGRIAAAAGRLFDRPDAGLALARELARLAL